MKRAIYLLAAVAMTVVFASCDKNDDHDSNATAEENIELRAAALGYADADDYRASVARQCAADNHENCDILSDGTHQVCAYHEHSGTKHDGSHHDGSGHGSYGSKGHSHH